MAAPDLIAAAGAVSSGTGTSTPVVKPDGAELDDLVVISFLVNGTPEAPTDDWTLALSADDAHAIFYARVDGTYITAADDAQTFTFGDGGGALYYASAIALVRGARAAGNPFDGDLAYDAVASSATTPPLEVHTLRDDDLLVMFAYNLFETRAASSVTAPLSLVSGAASLAHIASGDQAAAGASGEKVLTYAASSTLAWSQLVAVRGLDPADDPAERLGDGLRKSMNRIAGTTGMDAQGAANVWAGTTGLSFVGACNARAGTYGWGIKKVLNYLASSGSVSGEDRWLSGKRLDAAGAASQIQ